MIASRIKNHKRVIKISNAENSEAATRGVL